MESRVWLLPVPSPLHFVLDIKPQLLQVPPSEHGRSAQVPFPPLEEGASPPEQDCRESPQNPFGVPPLTAGGSASPLAGSLCSEGGKRLLRAWDEMTLFSQIVF